MPKRTNEFQKLVYLVRTNLAAGATVTESKMLRDRVTRKQREVDVCIEGRVGGQAVMVCVECRDHKRPADVQWVDALCTKHERLPTNALILASKSGFTPEARRVAEAYGIETFSLEDVNSTDFPSLIGANGTLWTKTVSITPTKVTATVLATDSLPEETVVLLQDNLLYIEDGSELCQATEYVQAVANSNAVRDCLLAEGQEEHTWFEFRCEPPHDALKRPLFMKKLAPLVLRPISSFRIIGQCEFKIAPFAMHRAKLGGVHVSWGKTIAHGRLVLLVATMDDTGGQKVSITELPEG
ncbi:MAG: hypothetical protein DID90_2727552286 [Candidatus Nitrotoga sp. LAW]|nr:MAG: hypothetical protein DID90_2727552286 [Candidatus Nitrotoga sp. LAW]